MKTKLIGSALASVALCVSLSSCSMARSTYEPQAHTPTTTQCEEDQPCWDCHTMGNHVCGTPTQLGPYTVTGDIHTVPASDAYGHICWTEYNPYLLPEDGDTEGICGDPAKAHPEYFLHWGLDTRTTVQQTTDDY